MVPNIHRQEISFDNQPKESYIMQNQNSLQRQSTASSMKSLTPLVLPPVPRQSTSSSNQASGFHFGPMILPSQNAVNNGVPAFNFVASNHHQQNMLRSGKWLSEEEDYANLLIDLFEKGQITDCENGATLRSFLSLKLQCPAMRISKKYAGKGIGKMVYLNRLNIGIHVPLEEHVANETKLKEAEQRFRKAIFPYASNEIITVPFSSQIITPVNPIGVPTISMMSRGNILETNHQRYIPFGLPTDVCGNSNYYPLMMATSSTVQQNKTDVTSASGTTPTCVSPHLATSTTSNTSSIAEEQKKLLHQAYMKALSDHCGIKKSSQNEELLQSRHPIKYAGSQSCSFQKIEANQIPNIASLTEADDAASPIPNLYPSFDRIVSRNINRASVSKKVPPNQLEIQHVPRFDGSSPDESYRFVGQKISNSDCSASDKSERSSRCDPTEADKGEFIPAKELSHNADVVAVHSLFTTEIYDVFKPQTSVNTFHHSSVYDITSKVKGNGSFDIDGTLNLLAQYTSHGFTKQDQHPSRTANNYVGPRNSFTCVVPLATKFATDCTSLDLCMRNDCSGVVSGSESSRSPVLKENDYDCDSDNDSNRSDEYSVSDSSSDSEDDYFSDYVSIGEPQINDKKRRMPANNTGNTKYHRSKRRRSHGGK